MPAHQYLKHKAQTIRQKHHDAPMKKRDLYFALHCEWVEVSKDRNALKRVTLLNWDLEVVLDSFIASSTNSQPGTRSFASVRQKIRKTLVGKILVGHNVAHHLIALRLKHPSSDVRDTAKYFRIYNENQHPPSVSLVDLTEVYLNRTLPIDLSLPEESCKATLDLYKNHRKVWEEQLAATQLDEIQSSSLVSGSLVYQHQLPATATHLGYEGYSPTPSNTDDLQNPPTTITKDSMILENRNNESWFRRLGGREPTHRQLKDTTSKQLLLDQETIQTTISSASFSSTWSIENSDTDWLHEVVKTDNSLSSSWEFSFSQSRYPNRTESLIISAVKGKKK